ncbi:hypothetical protein CEQ90_03085 [Lewinellaceae bacterium SD302]|nr:hypothetical protein CEQ90_03085 [Lewinellaceae bacterium SD302]
MYRITHYSFIMQYTKSVFFLFFLLFIISGVEAQRSYDRTGYGRYNKAVFLELGGSAGIYSFNYDMRLNRGRQDGIGFRVGVGGLSARVTANDQSGRVGYIAIPATFNYVLGQRRHGLELGIGGTLFHVNGEAEDSNDSFDFDGTAAVPHLNLGYRYQALNDGLFFRLTYTPFIGLGHMAGVSLGFNFK